MWRLSFGVLDEDHSERDRGTLANEVYGVLGHWLQKLDGILMAEKTIQRMVSGCVNQWRLTVDPVPAHEIPKARVAPCRTCGL